MLGPRASQDAQFLEDLEKTMTLLVFPHDSLDPSLAALLQPGLRRDVADQVNKVVLERQNHRRDAAVHNLLMMRAWSENTVRNETKKDLPARIELGLDGDDDDKQNGHDEPMVTTQDDDDNEPELGAIEPKEETTAQDASSPDPDHGSDVPWTFHHSRLFIIVLADGRRMWTVTGVDGMDTGFF